MSNGHRGEVLAFLDFTSPLQVKIELASLVNFNFVISMFPYFMPLFSTFNQTMYLFLFLNSIYFS